VAFAALLVAGLGSVGLGAFRASLAFRRGRNPVR